MGIAITTALSRLIFAHHGQVHVRLLLLYSEKFVIAIADVIRLGEDLLLDASCIFLVVLCVRCAYMRAYLLTPILVVDNMRSADILSPTPVQMQTLPLVLQGRDILAAAPPGSGKS